MCFLKATNCYQLELGKELVDASTQCSGRPGRNWGIWAMHYAEDIRHRRSKVSEDRSSLPPSSSQPSATRNFKSSSGLNTSMRVSSACKGPPSPKAPVLCHGRALWSPPSASGRWHAWLQLTSQSSLACRHLGFPSVSFPVSVLSPLCWPGCSCRGYDIPHWIAYRAVAKLMYPWPWSTLSGESARA